MTYEQAYADRMALWRIGAGRDMTGMYEDQHDLEDLLAKPTKATAKACLGRQIDHWFTSGTDECDSPEDLVANHPHLDAIARRHGFSHLIPPERASKHD